jgi:hypothetical protein
MKEVESPRQTVVEEKVDEGLGKMLIDLVRVAEQPLVSVRERETLYVPGLLYDVFAFWERSRLPLPRSQIQDEILLGGLLDVSVKVILFSAQGVV